MHKGDRAKRPTHVGLMKALMGRTVFYVRALSFLFFALFGAAAVISSNSANPNRAIAFGLASAACFVIGTAIRYIVHVKAIARLFGRATS